MKQFFQSVRVRHALLPALIAAGLVFSGCDARKNPVGVAGPGQPTATVRIQAVASQRQAITEEVLGTVRARLQATVEAKMTGQIITLPVVLGQRVKAGELIARLEGAEINARLEQAEAALEQTERDVKRIVKLFEQQSSTLAELEATQVRQRVAKGLAAEVRATRSQLEVVAPFNGIVTKKWAAVGDLAAPGKPLVTLDDPSALQLEVELPLNIARQVQSNAHFTAHVDGVAGELTAIVTEIAPTADPASRTLQVNLNLPRQPGLSSGQFARLRVPIGESDSLRVPAGAVVPRGQLEIVFVVTDRRAHLRLVKTGRRFGEEWEILAGLQAGEQVVIEGASQLTDGQPVEVK